MADVAFNSSDHKLTASDVPQGEEGLQKSSQAVTELSNGQKEQYWTPEPAARDLGTAVANFFSACDEAFSKEKDALREFGTNVDLAIAEFARVNESTGDELKRIQDSITNPEIREKLGKGLPQAGAPAAQEADESGAPVQTDGSDTSATEAPTAADAAYSGPSHFGQSAPGGPAITGQ
ncbi:hypothetical protein [Schaalia odontolytica]|uniref:hypothetical protein n=1 Tax=Schaalia odontolytica TaxID=1660 RepID=UPI00210E40E6|nr:hypothetical protein [Schaalia odontolytica]MCQ5272823.1 hypothetical protein [Schaalia odontolytica]MCQ5281633.1 hypothetical protein [Schaalia odontolytica]